jgi:hypothetical protein
MNESSIEVITVKLQLYNEYSKKETDFLMHEKSTKEKQLEPLLNCIFDWKETSVASLDGYCLINIELYRKLVEYISKSSNLSPPSDLASSRELTTALESVFPLSDIPSFMSLNRHEKLTQLNGLTRLVSGIRIFNKSVGRGGAAVVNGIGYFM